MQVLKLKQTNMLFTLAEKWVLIFPTLGPARTPLPWQCWQTVGGTAAGWMFDSLLKFFTVTSAGSHFLDKNVNVFLGSDGHWQQGVQIQKGISLLSFNISGTQCMLMHLWSDLSLYVCSSIYALISGPMYVNARILRSLAPMYVHVLMLWILSPYVCSCTYALISGSQSMLLYLCFDLWASILWYLGPYVCSSTYALNPCTYALISGSLGILKHLCSKFRVHMYAHASMLWSLGPYLCTVCSCTYALIAWSLCMLMYLCSDLWVPMYAHVPIRHVQTVKNRN